MKAVSVHLPVAALLVALWYVLCNNAVLTIMEMVYIKTIVVIALYELMATTIIKEEK